VSPPRGDEARPLDRTSHTLFEDAYRLMRRDLSLGIPIPSRQLRGIGIPRYIAAAEAQEPAPPRNRNSALHRRRASLGAGSSVESEFRATSLPRKLRAYA